MAEPAFITFTGADDRTSLADMAALAKDFPGKIEFGILGSSKWAGEPRYPSDVTRFRNLDARLSLHVCGQAARRVSRGEQTDLPGNIVTMGQFARVQVNGIPGSNCSVQAASDFGTKHGVRVILQSGNQFNFPIDTRVSWLFDKSGGVGKLPECWPQAPAASFCGFAGGLGPDTLDEFEELAARNKSYWLDMETKVRNTDDEFDLRLCRRVCEVVFR